MSNEAGTVETVADLGPYWRKALRAASQHVDEQVAGTAMLLTAVQLLKSGMGVEGATNFLEILSRAVRDGEMVSIAIGDVTLNLKDGGVRTQ